jgi:hypothetical protein
VLELEAPTSAAEGEDRGGPAGAPEALRAKPRGPGGGGGSVAELRDDRDAARDVARDLVEAAATLASLKVEAIAWLSGPSYYVLRFSLEEAHSAVEAAVIEARRRVRLNEEREQ